MVSAAAKRAGRLAESTEAVDDAVGLPAGRPRRAPRGQAQRHTRLAVPRPRPGEGHDAAGAVRAQAREGRRARRRTQGGPGGRRRDVRELLPRPRAARPRRRVGQPRPAPRLGAAGGADERRDVVARQGLRRPHRGHDLGDARARRHVRRGRGHHGAARRGRPGLARARRGQPVRLPAAGDRLCRAAPAGARSRRPQRADPRRDRGAGPGSRRPHPRAVLLDARGQGGHRGDARAVRRRHRVPLPGRGPDHHAGAPVRPRPADLPVRHPHPLAGRRRARLGLPARHHRPDPVPAARRPALVGALAGHRPDGRQRLHGRVGHPRRAAPRPRAPGG